MKKKDLTITSALVKKYAAYLRVQEQAASTVVKYGHELAGAEYIRLVKAVRKEVPGAAPCHGPASRIATDAHTLRYTDERNTCPSASKRASP